MQNCDGCHTNLGTMRCTGCLGTYYCSVTCQINDKSKHKTICNNAKLYITKEQRENPRIFDEFFNNHLKSAKNGNSESQYLIGFCYLYKIGINFNFNEALRWITHSAEGGYNKAQYLLGEIYSSDIWKVKNYSISFKWYNAAAKSGFIAGMVKIIDLYNSGIGVEMNKKKGFKLLVKLASSGYIPAQFSLGGRYIKGYDVEIDYVKGYKWLKKAEEAGCDKAKIVIDSLCFFATQSHIDKSIKCTRE